MRVELLKELAALRDKYLLVVLHKGEFAALSSPEGKAFRAAFCCSATRAPFDAQEMRVWRRICRTVPDPPAVVIGKGCPVELP